MSEQPNCVICGEPVEPWPTREGEQPGGYGNNPDPVATEGRACDACNASKVIPARFADLAQNGR